MIENRLNDGKSDSGELRDTSGHRPISPLEAEILRIAREIMKERYLLDLDALYKRCLRVQKQSSPAAIYNAMMNLVKSSIIAEGKSRTRMDLLENETRRRIYELVKARPGLRVCSIAREIGVTLTTAGWHLHQLEHFQMVRQAVIDGTALHFDFFADRKYDRLFYHFNRKGMREILSFIISRGKKVFVSQMETDSGIPSTSLTRKLSILIEAGLISFYGEGGVEGGGVLEIPPSVIEIIGSYI